MKILGVGLSDVAKLAAAIEANLLLRDHVIKLAFLEDFAPAIEALVSVLLAAFFVLALSALLFARPVLAVQWRKDDERTSQKGDVMLRYSDGDGPTLYDVQVSFVRGSVWASFITSRLRKHQPTLLMDLKHPNAVKFSRERSQQTDVNVKISNTRVTFPISSGGYNNETLSWALIGLNAGRVPDDLAVKCGYSLQPRTKWLRWWSLWLRTEANVDAVQLIRIA